MRVLLPLILALLAWTPPAAASEIYRWTDAQGRVHFSQDLSQVPAEHRKEAELSRHRVRRHEVQTYESNATPARADRNPRVRPAVPGSGRRLEMPFEMRGTSMWVYAQINDRISVPFIVDTGASDVSVPGHAASAAGIIVDADTPRAVYHTANGAVEQPIVTLDSVQVGEVRVEGVRGSLNDSMQVGLLGGSFFNNFTFQVDPAAQIITLVPNASMRAGIAEPEWRRRFAEVHGQLAKLDAYLEENVFSRESRRAELARKRELLLTRIDELEHEADRAGVPEAWRH